MINVSSYIFLYIDIFGKTESPWKHKSVFICRWLVYVSE